VLPTIVSSREEEAALKEVALPWYRFSVGAPSIFKQACCLLVKI
jgi:hypothetical protein